MKDSSHQYRRWHQLKEVWMMRHSGVLVSKRGVVVAECSVTCQCVHSRRREGACRFCPLRMNRGSVFVLTVVAILAHLSFTQMLYFRRVFGNLPSTWVFEQRIVFGYLVICFGFGIYFFFTTLNFITNFNISKFHLTFFLLVCFISERSAYSVFLPWWWFRSCAKTMPLPKMRGFILLLRLVQCTQSIRANKRCLVHCEVRQTQSS